MTVLVVSGSRDGHPHVSQVLDRWVAKHGAPELVVLGDAFGVDAGARSWAIARSHRHQVHRADWLTHGRRAGPMRNLAMVQAGRIAGHLVAFPVGESRGTRDCMRQALAAGLTVFEVDLRGVPKLVSASPSPPQHER